MDCYEMDIKLNFYEVNCYEIEAKMQHKRIDHLYEMKMNICKMKINT